MPGLATPAAAQALSVRQLLFNSSIPLKLAPPRPTSAAPHRAPRAAIPAAAPDFCSPALVQQLRAPSAGFSSRGALFAAAPRDSPAQPGPGAARAMASEAAIVAPVEVLVKAAVGHPETLGDCPFSQRVLLTLEEKGLPYAMRLVDTGNKPQWFLEANPEGKVPVVKTQQGWLADSDVITAELEKDFPQSRSLAPPAGTAPAAPGLFGAFARFLRGAGSEEDLLAQLQLLEGALEASGGPFVAGADFTADDARLAPTLFHIQTALPHFKQWRIPPTLPHVLQYTQALQARESFRKTAPSAEAVLAGWGRALGQG